MTLSSVADPLPFPSLSHPIRRGAIPAPARRGRRFGGPAALSSSPRFLTAQAMDYDVITLFPAYYEVNLTKITYQNAGYVGQSLGLAKFVFCCDLGNYFA
jgi:hypothetical protein